MRVYYLTLLFYLLPAWNRTTQKPLGKTLFLFEDFNLRLFVFEDLYLQNSWQLPLGYSEKQKENLAL